MAARGAGGEHQRARKPEAQGHAILRRERCDLERNGIPGRGPREDADGKELPVGEALHREIDAGVFS